MADESSKQARHADLHTSKQSAEKSRPPITWIYIPFSEKESGDQQAWAQSLIDEHAQRGAGKHKRQHVVVQADPNAKSQLGKVKEHDTLMIFGHGNEDDPEHLFSSREKGKGEKIPYHILTSNLTGQDLNPLNVNMKVGACYSGGLHPQPTPEAALQQDTFAKRFANHLAQIVTLEDHLGQPKQVDGYTGAVSYISGPITPDLTAQSDRRQHGWVVPMTHEDVDALNSEIVREREKEIQRRGHPLSKADQDELDVEIAKRLATSRQHQRARDNRVRYKINPPEEDGDNPTISVDQQDFARAKAEREKNRPKQGVDESALQGVGKQGNSTHLQPIIEPPQLIDVGGDTLTVTPISLPPEFFEARKLLKQSKSLGMDDL